MIDSEQCHSLLVNIFQLVQVNVFQCEHVSNDSIEQTDMIFVISFTPAICQTSRILPEENA